jgi:hypothetical protein
MRRMTPWLAVAALCAALVAVAARYGSYVAGGSDSYCYTHQAERWASGRLLEPEPLARDAPWPGAPLTFAPAGHRPSPTVPGAIVPICPSGLSMLMAPALALGGRAAMFAVVPTCGVVLVVATWLLGKRLSDGVGLSAATVIAASPVVLFQTIQPMSDVPAAAFWVLALASVTGTQRRDAVAAGLGASIALLIRPNLLPLGLVIGVSLLVRPGRTWRERAGDGAAYAVLCAAACVVVLLVQRHFYGSPFASGYGSLGDIFAMAHVGPNASRYASWLVGAQTPLILLALAGPFVLPRAFAATCLSFCIVTLLVYLPYLVFEDWSYLRFLLPAIPVLVVLALGVVAATARRAGGRAVPLTLAVATMAVVTLELREARTRQVFRLAELESVFERAGRAAGARLPSNALVITSRFSGSVRFYGARPTLVWDALDPAWLDRAIAFARQKGFEPYLLLDSAEEPAFRARFSDSTLARLDWPPQLEIAPQVRVYQPAARPRYLAGETIATEYVR